MWRRTPSPQSGGEPPGAVGYLSTPGHREGLPQHTHGTSRRPQAFPLFILCVLGTALLAASACDDDPPVQVPTSSTHGVVDTRPSDSQSQDDPEPSVTEGPWAQTGRVIYSFADNRHLLHIYDRSLYIDFGTPSALKYIQGRWKSPWGAGQWDDGHRVAWSNGLAVTFRFPWSDTTEDAEVVFRLRALGNNQRLDLFLNDDENAVASVDELSGEWELVRITLPRQNLVAGENRIRVHFARSVERRSTGRTAAGFDWARIGPVGMRLEAYQESATVVEAETPGALIQVGPLRVDDQDLLTPALGGWTAYFMVPNEARLRVRLSASWPAGTGSGVPVRLTLTQDSLHEEDTPGQSTWSGDLWSGTVSVAPLSLEIDLSRQAGQIVRLEMMGMAESGNGGTVRWEDPVLVVPEREAYFFDQERRPRQILIWLVNSLRADTLPHYNPDSVVDAPNFSDLSNDCVNFRRAVSQGDNALAASGSLHTGTYPSLHELSDLRAHLPTALHNLGYPFERRHWQTALFSSDGIITESRGFARGFDAYFNLIHQPDHGEPNAGNVWQLGQSWLETLDAGARWLLFLNTAEPHAPYAPPARFAEAQVTEPYNGEIAARGTALLVQDIQEGVAEPLTNADINYMRALYQGEVAYNDATLGEVIQFLLNENLYNETLLVLLADHGESLFDEGRVGHGVGLFREVVHVPLMICHPPSLGNGRWVNTEVELVDVLPTLLEIMDIEVPEWVQGWSLLDLMMDPTPLMPRPGVAYHQNSSRALMVGPWLYRLRTGDDDALSNTDRLSNADASEVQDLRVAAPISHRYLRDVLAFHLAYDRAWDKVRWGVANNHTSTFAVYLDGQTW